MTCATAAGSGLEPAFVGIDVSFSKSKRLPIVICVWRANSLIPFALKTLPLAPPLGGGNLAVLDQQQLKQYATQALQYVVAICRQFKLQPLRIGLDAPLIPRSNGLSRRVAEQALDQARIHCFTTPSFAQLDEIKRKVAAHIAAGGAANRLPHANQLWMLAGFALAETFSNLAPCIEVFPQATIRCLGAGKQHKTRVGAVDEQLARVAGQTNWPSLKDARSQLRQICYGAPHDCLDAYISAWTASLPEQRRHAFGDPNGDAIWIPRVRVGKTS